MIVERDEDGCVIDLDAEEAALLAELLTERCRGKPHYPFAKALAKRLRGERTGEWTLKSYAERHARGEERESAAGREGGG